MTDVLLFHHAQGCTPGVLAFADHLGAHGHAVHVPDLYEGKLFADLGQGAEHARTVGFDTIIQRGVEAADGLPTGLVYIGFSLGVLPAQALAQHRPGAAGAVLIGACVPPTELGCPWPRGVPVQIHGMVDDRYFAREGDVDAARELVSETDRAELFLYPGSGHLFADASVADHDEPAAALLTERVLAFLTRR